MWRGNLDQTMLYLIEPVAVSPEESRRNFITLICFPRLEPYLESVLAFSGGTPLHLVFIRFGNLIISKCASSFIIILLFDLGDAFFSVL